MDLHDLTDSLSNYFPDHSGHPILLQNVQSLLDSVRDKHRENLALLQRVDALLDRLSSVSSSRLSDNKHLGTYSSQAQAQLHQTLDQATSGLPPQRHNLSRAQCDHISAMIESSLVKISLLRARARRSLYGASSQQEGIVTTAVTIAYRKLKADEARAREEERALDHKLAEYQDLLVVVDGNDGGGFQQIVNDWTRVQKETEECRKDLRRLGWTGD